MSGVTVVGHGCLTRHRSCRGGCDINVGPWQLPGLCVHMDTDPGSLTAAVTSGVWPYRKAHQCSAFRLLMLSLTKYCCSTTAGLQALAAATWK